VDNSPESAVTLGRVGRFGPRSLGFRLLVVLLVPMCALQLFAFREVRRQQAAARAASVVSAEATLLSRTASLIVPLALENTATVTMGKGGGSIDFDRVRAEARAAIDNEFPVVLGLVADLNPPNRAAVANSVAEVRAALQKARRLADAGTADTAAVQAEFDHVIALTTDLNVGISDELRWAASTDSLVAIAAETDTLVAAVRYAADEFRHLAHAGMSDDPRTALDAMLAAAGAFKASMQQLERLVGPDRLPDLEALINDTRYVKVDNGLAEFTDAVGSAAVRGVALAATRDSDVLDTELEAALVRLTLLQQYSATFMADEVAIADAARADADSTQRDAIIVMISTFVVSVVLLWLVIRSVLRPLRRLVRVSRAVRNGDLGIKPATPSGPTDVKVVMRAFNDMVATLRTYEQQLALLAQGHTDVDGPLPGPLGDTVRRNVGQVADLTAQLHESQAAAFRQARTDALSGLANRTAALERLSVISLEARQTGVLGAVIFLDLDGFKSVNDTQGHAEGDRILVEIARRLQAACPNGTVARMGGDEFLVLLHEIASPDEVVDLARHLIAAISEPCTGSSGQLFTLSASAGIAYIDGQREPLASIAQADTAVYHAKERGRGRVEVFDHRLSDVIESRAEMALTMRHALADGQFSLRLQPIVEVATSHPVGAEVLLRWERPDTGLIGPAEFIPIAERTGVIVDLETWVLEQAVAILREWRLDPVTANMHLAVNISGRHVIEGNLAGLLAELCNRASVDPRLIDLEITETHLVADIARAGSVVDDLRAQGVNVAIDDFGTGYSSMTYLHRLTVDTLKIDQAFVAGMCDDRLDRTIVELLLRLGDSLGMHVVAEGVDSSRKLALLKELGCPWAQGFHIAKPMRVDDATRWLRQQVALAASIVSTP
jgi:diguanylate cyclase (GGDEF)-like protein